MSQALSTLRNIRILEELNLANAGTITWKSASMPGSALTADAGVLRSQMAQVDLQPIPIELDRWKVTGTLAALGNTPGTPASAFAITPGTHGAASPILSGETASGNSKTNIARALVTLPDRYVAGETVTLRVHARITALANTANTLDLEARESDQEAGVSAELHADAAKVLTVAWADHDFTITPTNLVAGDDLDLELTGLNNDTGGSSGGIIQIGHTALLCDMQG